MISRFAVRPSANPGVHFGVVALTPHRPGQSRRECVSAIRTPDGSAAIPPLARGSTSHDAIRTGLERLGLPRRALHEQRPELRGRAAKCKGPDDAKSRVRYGCSRVRQSIESDRAIGLFSLCVLPPNGSAESVENNRSFPHCAPIHRSDPNFAHRFEF